jgi:ABC-type lipoprotein export system ATPase subunit
VRGHGVTTQGPLAPVRPPRGRGHLGRAEIAISARGLTGHSPAGAEAEVRDISLDVVRGQITVIAGAPGSDSPALLRLLAGLDRPSAGVVWIGDRRIDAGPGRPHWRFRRDQLAFIGAGRGGAPAPGIDEILRLLAVDPVHAFLDEPALGAGRADLDRVYAALHELTGLRGRTALVATSRPDVAAWADRLLVVDRGTLVLDVESPTRAEAAAAVAR